MNPSMRHLLTQYFHCELIEQDSPESLSKRDKRKLDRFDAKEKNEKLEKKLNKEVCEYLEDRLSTRELKEFKSNNNINGKGLSDYQFISQGSDGKFVAKTLNFGTNTSAESDYQAFLEGSLGKYLEDVNLATDTSKQEQKEVVHDIESTRRHNSWTLDNSEDFTEYKMERKIEKSDAKMDKFQGKSDLRGLDKLDDTQDAVLDDLKDFLKSNYTQLNKRERKEVAKDLFNKLYAFEKFEDVTATMEISYGKGEVIVIGKKGLESIFANILKFKTEFHDPETFSGDRKMERYKRRLEDAQEQRDDIYKEYIDKLKNATSVSIGENTINLQSTENAHYRSIFLLADINFDGQMKPANDLSDGQYKRSRLGRFMVEGVLRSVGMSVDKSGDGQNYRKYAKSFKNQPINNNLETQISTAWEIANARIGQQAVETNIKALLSKAFQIDTSIPLYDLLASNIEYGIFLKRICIMEPDILIGLFEKGPEAITAKYDANNTKIMYEDQGRLQYDVDNLMLDKELQTTLTEKISEGQIDAVVAELKTQAQKETDPDRKKEMDKVIASLEKPETKEESRNKLRWQIASGGLMAIVGAMYRERHQVIATYSDQNKNTPVRIDADGNFLTKEQAYNPDGSVKDPNTTIFQSFEDNNTLKDKIKRTNFVYGLGTGGMLLGESNGRYKQSVTYGVSALYTDFAKNDPSGQKDGFSFGLSLAYNGSLGLSKEIGTSGYYGTNMNFGVGAGLGVDTKGKLAFGPFAYLGVDQLLNKRKLTRTLDAKGAKRLRAGATVSLEKGILNAVPNLGIGNDRIEGYEIIENNLKNTLSPIIEDILLGLKGKEVNANTIASELEGRYKDVLRSLDTKLSRSKPKNLRRSAELLGAIIQTYAGEKPVTGDGAENYIKRLAPQLSTVFANQWRNENIEKLKGLKITSVNVGSIFTLALFGVVPVSILAVALGTVGMTKYSRAVAENETESLALAKDDMENNYSAEFVELETEKDFDGIGNKKSIQIIRDTLKSIDPKADVNELIKAEESGAIVYVDPKVASMLEIRIAKTFLVEESDDVYVKKNVKDYLRTHEDTGKLRIPGDMVAGISEMVDKNTRKTVLSIGRVIDMPLSECDVWTGKELFDGEPKQFDGMGGYKTEEIYTLYPALKDVFDLKIDSNGSNKKLVVAHKAGDSNLTAKGIDYIGSANPSSALGLEVDYPLDGKKLSFVHHNYGNTDRRVVAVEENKDQPFSVGYTEVTDKSTISGESKDINPDALAVDPGYRTMINGIDHKYINRVKFNNKYGKSDYILFSQALDGDPIDFENAANLANKVVSKLQAAGADPKGRYTFTKENPSEILDFAKELIGSDYCNTSSGNVKVGKNREKTFDTLKTMRDSGFERRWTKSGYNSDYTIIGGYRDDSFASALSGAGHKNTHEVLSFGQTKHSEMLSLVYGYDGKNDSLDEKLVIAPEVVDKSMVGIDDEGLRKEIVTRLNTKYGYVYEGGIKSLIEAKVAGATIQGLDDLISGEKDSVEVTDTKGNKYTVHIDYHFFIYPECFNESVGISLDFQPQVPPVVEYAPLTPGQAGPTGMWLNGTSVMQRAAVTGVNIGATLAGTYTKDVPEYVTTQIQHPETPTTVPQISVWKDGVELKIDLAPGLGYIMDLPYTEPPLQLGIQFTGYDDNGVPQYFFSVTDADFNGNTYYTLQEFMNSPDWAKVHQSIQEQLYLADQIYLHDYDVTTSPAVGYTPKPITKAQLAYYTNVATLAGNRKGTPITQTDRTQKKN